MGERQKRLLRTTERNILRVVGLWREAKKLRQIREIDIFLNELETLNDRKLELQTGKVVA